MMNVEAKEIKTGHRILVTENGYQVERTVDLASHDQEGGFVTFVLFSPDGYNQKLRVRENAILKRV
jgi:hypothetical protein